MFMLSHVYNGMQGKYCIMRKGNREVHDVSRFGMDNVRYAMRHAVFR